MIWQQLLPPSSGIGNGYSDSLKSVGKLFHLDILPKGISFLDVNKYQVEGYVKNGNRICFMAACSVETEEVSKHCGIEVSGIVAE